LKKISNTNTAGWFESVKRKDPIPIPQAGLKVFKKKDSIPIPGWFESVKK
jgi:hypothetical protein